MFEILKFVDWKIHIIHKMVDFFFYGNGTYQLFFYFLLVFKKKKSFITKEQFLSRFSILFSSFSLILWIYTSIFPSFFFFLLTLFLFCFKNFLNSFLCVNHNEKSLCEFFCNVKIRRRKKEIL